VVWRLVVTFMRNITSQLKCCIELRALVGVSSFSAAETMEYGLSDEFCRRHFLVGILLREVCGCGVCRLPAARQCGVCLFVCLFVGGVSLGV